MLFAVIKMQCSLEIGKRMPGGFECFYYSLPSARFSRIIPSKRLDGLIYCTRRGKTVSRTPLALLHPFLYRRSLPPPFVSLSFSLSPPVLSTLHGKTVLLFRAQRAHLNKKCRRPPATGVTSGRRAGFLNHESYL